MQHKGSDIDLLLMDIKLLEQQNIQLFSQLGQLEKMLKESSEIIERVTTKVLQLDDKIQGLARRLNKEIRAHETEYPT